MCSIHPTQSHSVKITAPLWRRDGAQMALMVHVLYLDRYVRALEINWKKVVFVW